MLKSAALAVAGVLALAVSSPSTADPFPPYWDGGAGEAVHFPPVAWPAEPSDPVACGATCGDWKPYTRFQNSANDPRVQDPSNGGTAPQNYTNIASSCIDKNLPSIYYSLRQGATEADDVLMFRWRVEQIANTYATGPSAGSFSASNPWNSALWTVLFDLDGSGYRTLAAHLNGSSGSPAQPIDMLAGIYGRIPTQSIDYNNDPANITLLGHNPTAFVDRGSSRILNFNNTLTPSSAWPNGSAETRWDYGTTRAIKVSTRSCTEYFVDYQIPVKMLDASAVGGPKITRSTPLSMMFCTANSLNNPFQKDCSINRTWVADPNKPAPFGDYISFDQLEPYSQPIIRDIVAQAPSTCDQTYTLTATVQDTLAVQNGVVRSSLQSVSFWYYHDVNADGVSNDGSAWRYAADADQVPGTLNKWTAAWDASALPKGRYLIGAQALDDNTLVDDGMTPSGVDNRTFSYVTSNAQGEVFINGETPAWKIDQSFFPMHSPTLDVGDEENWFGNPAITGIQVATAGVDLAVNACGVAPTVGKTASPENVAVGEPVTFTISVSNPASNGSDIVVTQLADMLPSGFTFVSTTGGTLAGFASQPGSGATGSIAWVLNSPASVAPGATATLSFTASSGSLAGRYNNIASASVSGYGMIESSPVGVNVDAARLSISKTPNTYLINPDGTTQLTYTIAYSNDSAVALTSARIDDVLPAGVTYADCSGGLSCANLAGTVQWQLGNLAGGAVGSVTLTVTVDTDYASASLLNTATLHANDPAGSPLSRSTSAKIAVNSPVPAFTLDKTANVGRVDPLGNVTWTLAYRNYGTGPAGSVLLVDKLPDGFTYASCSVTGSTHFVGCSHAAGTVTFHNGAGAGVSIPAGGSGTVTIVASAAAAPFTYPNPAVNTGTLTWSGDPTGVSANSPVGVSGQFCEAVYYFHSGGVANLIAPTSSTTQVLSPNSGAQIIFTGVAPKALDLGNKTLTISFYMAASTGNSSFSVSLFNVTKNAAIASSAPTTVSNSGGVPQLNNFTVVVPAGVTVDAGDTLRWTFTLTYSGQGATFHYDSTANPSRSSVCVAASPANLILAKTVDKASISGAVEKLSYTIRYANTGGTATSGTTITDTLPAGASNCEASINGTNWSACSGAGEHVFSIGSIAAGGTGVVFVRADSPAVATPGQSLVNSATIDSDQTTPVSDSASTLVGLPGGGGGSPALVVTKVADKGLIGANETVTYTLTVVNVGDGAAATVSVLDTMPVEAYFSYVTDSIQGGNARTVNGAELSWTLLSLAVGEKAVLSYRMKSNASIPAGITTLVNTATLSDADYCKAPKPAACTSNQVDVSLSGSPNLQLDKSASPDTGLSPGDTVTWTLALRNNGSAPATNVVVSDPIVAGTSFVSAGPGGVFDAVGNRVVFSVPSLVAGGRPR